MTRQRKWQLKQIKLKRCIICGSKTKMFITECELHRLKRKQRYEKFINMSIL